MKKAYKFSRKEFANYLANGGNIGFKNTIYFNKTQYDKLNNEQRSGKEPVYIDNKIGFMNSKKAWIPKND